MKNAGSTSSDEENESTRDLSSKFQKIDHSGKKQVNTKRLNREDDLKKDEDKKENTKHHKIRMPQRKGGLQLWQFIYALLEDADKKHSRLIEWTPNREELEFRLNDPEAIALWWGVIKHRSNMTYERLSRSLRYYYDRGILKKMGGERYLYRFCIDPEDMYKHIGLSDSRPVLKPMPLPVNEWVCSKMISPAHHLEPFYLNHEYMSLGMSHATHQLPPPPPYPGYHFQSPHYQISAGTHMTGYDFFTDHESKQNFIFNQPTSHNCAANSFNISPLTSHDTNFTFTAQNTSLAVSSTSSISSYKSQVKSEQEQSLSNTELTSNMQQQGQDVFQYSPEPNMHFQYDCNSSTGSGSELDEIIPLLESMEDTNCVPTSICISPCSIDQYKHTAGIIDAFQHAPVSLPSTNYITSPSSQLSLQTSPTISRNGFYDDSPSAWAGDEDTWKI